MPPAGYGAIESEEGESEREVGNPPPEVNTGSGTGGGFSFATEQSPRLRDVVGSDIAHQGSAGDSTGSGWGVSRSAWLRAGKKMMVSIKVKNMLETFDGSRYEAAAFMVHEAWSWDEGGVEMDGRLLSPDPQSRRLYRHFHNVTWLRRLPVIMLLILNIFELPGWCRDTRCEAYEGSPSGWQVFLEPVTFHVLEFSCIALLLIETHFMLVLQSGYVNVWGVEPVIWFKIGVLVLLAGDSLVSMLTGFWFRIGGYLRIALFAITVPQVRKSCYNVAYIVPRFISVALLFMSYVAFGGWLALAALSGTDEEETYKDLWTAITLMTVLLTTANNPDVWLGAYHKHRLWGVFFLVYVCFGNFYLMSLLLATIYGVYKEQAAETVMECDRQRAECLRAAFQLLDKDEKGYVESEQVVGLVEALNMHTDIPTISPSKLPALIACFTDSEYGRNDIQIKPSDFEVLVEQLQTKFGDVPNPALQRKHWGPYLGPLLFSRVKALHFVRTQSFGKFVTIMLAFNGFVVFIEWNKELLDFDDSNDAVIHTVEGIFGMLYVVEMLIKWGGYSFVRYWKDPINAYDGVITIVSAIIEIMLVLPNGFNDAMFLRWLIVMRVLRLTRLLGKVQLYKVIIATFFRLLPALFPLLCTLGCIVGIYATYGVQQFGGLAYANNPDLEGTTFLASGYLDMNLNDFSSAIVTLVCQCVVNNWFVIMDGYVAMSGTELTRIYFITFYFIATVFVLNLVIVVILDAAMAIIEQDMPIIAGPARLQDSGEVARSPRRSDGAGSSGGVFGGDGDDDDDSGGDEGGGGGGLGPHIGEIGRLDTSKDAFIAPKDTRKGQAQRAILKFRNELDQIRTSNEESDDEDFWSESTGEEDDSVSPTVGLGSGGTTPTMRGRGGSTSGSNTPSSIFDPGRGRLSGGNSALRLNVNPKGGKSWHRKL